MQNVNKKKLEGFKTTEVTIGDSEKAKVNGVFYVPLSFLSNGEIVIGIERMSNISDCHKDSIIIGVEIPNKNIQIAKNNYILNWEFINEEDNAFGFDVFFTKSGNAILHAGGNTNIVSAIKKLVEKISA